MMERGHILPVPGRPIMSSHPDADAFMRGYLRNPPDVTARLVFADWLEETGKPWNRAWAYYIRLKAEAGHRPAWTHERRELAREAARYASKIRARLMIPAALFVGYPKSLLELLPGPNITVRLDGFDVPPSALEVIPEAVARNNPLLPLAQQGRVLLIASVEPWNRDFAEKLGFVLNREVILVQGAPGDILAAVYRNYWQTAVEFGTFGFFELPEIAPGPGT
jgi:uncharacterized protein (TIGR02996 family)